MKAPAAHARSICCGFMGEAAGFSLPVTVANVAMALTFLDHAKRTVTLAWPIILAQGLSLIVVVVDTVMVGQAGGEELAYLSAGRSLMFVAMTVGIGLLGGVVVLTARADGANEPENCGRIWRSGLVYAALVGAGCCLVVSLGGPLALRMFGLAPSLVEGGGRYLVAMGLSIPGTCFLLASSYFLQGLGRPKPGMVIMMAMLPLTIFLNWLLIYGELGLPRLGAQGAALATAITQWLGAVILFTYILRNPELRRYGIGGGWRGGIGVAWRNGRELRHFGYPLGVASGLEFLGMTLLIMFAGQMGVVTISAFEVVLNMHLLAFIAAFGMATATAVRVGNAVGRRDFASIPVVGLSGVAIGLLFLSPFVALYLLAPDPFFRIFTEDPAILDAARGMLPFLVGAIVLDGVQYIFLHALRAAGDQLVAAVLQVTAFLAVMVPAGWISAVTLGLGGRGLTLGFLIGVLVAALILGSRFAVVTRRLNARAAA